MPEGGRLEAPNSPADSTPGVTPPAASTSPFSPGRVLLVLRVLLVPLVLRRWSLDQSEPHPSVAVLQRAGAYLPLPTSHSHTFQNTPVFVGFPLNPLSVAGTPSSRVTL